MLELVGRRLFFCPKGPVCLESLAVCTSESLNAASPTSTMASIQELRPELLVMTIINLI